MAFPINKTVSAGSRVRLGIITGSGNTPTPVTLTLGSAPSVGATSISLTAASSVIVQHDEVLTFSDGKTARINIPDGAGLTDTITIGTSATTVPVVALTSAITAASTAKTYALRELLGITNAAPPMQPQTVDATDMRSGFGQSNVVVGVNRTIQVSGHRVVGDRCMYEIVMPYLTSDETIQKLLYAEVYLSNGDFMSGPVRITDGGASNQVRNLLDYNFTLSFQGNTFNYVSGDTALFTAP